MKDAKTGEGLPSSTSHTMPQTRPKRSSRTWRTLLLLIIAGSVSTLLQRSLFTRTRSLRAVQAHFADPAEQFKDDIWPLRESEPWDISTDYPYPRVLEYDVTEGTWLRLDVHPKTGDVVFDMLGDLYCLPASDVEAAARGGEPVKARPVLVGVPHDSDAHFSPEGDRLVYRSDAGHGIENIWVMEWKGCEEADVRSASAGTELAQALASKVSDEEMLARGTKETEERRHARLLREGRLGAHRVTNETFRWVSDARFHPSGSSVIATKWYTSGRSLGAGEAWTYEVPSVDAKENVIKAGSGKRLIGRTLPPGWSASQYGDQQIGPEQFIWHGEDTVIYSKNVIDNGVFTYSKDVHTGIYSIFSKNLTTGRTERLVGANPGGASRPELSRDGRTLAFVRRVRDKEALVFKDLVTGSIHNIWHGLTYDLTTVSAPMGTYPSFAFTPDDSAVIIWAAGQIWRVPVSTNHYGERVAGNEPSPIEFTAHIETRIAETRSGKTDLLKIETARTARTYAFDSLKVDAKGERAVYHSAGRTYIQTIQGGRGKRSYPARVPHSEPDAPYFSPAFVPNAEHFVVHARWSDVNFTTFEIADLYTGRSYEFTGLPLGRFHSPTICACSGNKRTLAFVKTAGDWLTGDVLATGHPGLYLASFNLPDGKSDSIELKNVHFVTGDISGGDLQLRLRFLETNAKLLVEDSDSSFVIDLGAGADKLGKYAVTKLVSGYWSAGLAVSPPKGKGMKSDYVAFVDQQHVHIAPAKTVNGPVWSKPGNATEGLARLSLDGGHDLAWSADGKKLFWFLGPFLHSVEVSKLSECNSAIKEDKSTFGIACTHKLLDFEEAIATHSTDIQRLKEDVRTAGLANAESSALLVITNATLLTMHTNSPEDLVRDGVMFVRDGIIEAVFGAEENVVVPQNAVVIDAEGGFVLPGFIDVHAHWNGFYTWYPARSWELETFLAYGVTTLHNPSADTVTGFQERTRVENGLAAGPRIFTVGNIIYGAADGNMHHDIADMKEAYESLTQIKVEGGPASFSYKNYQLPSRGSRQRVLLAARNMSMLCFPEGGMNYDMDLTFIADGMTTIEHFLPVPRLYEDVLTFYALSGTGATPTHIVNYGGAWGEQLVWGHYDVPNDPKLRRFTRHDILESVSETTARPFNSYQLFNTSASVAAMVQKGLKAHIGAHGEPPLGLNYHAEMFFTQKGGLTNYETIRAATSDAAETLGLSDAIGSLAPGKLGDFIVYHPDVDILEGDIKESARIKYVVRGGRVWNAKSLEEVWPVKGRRPAMPPFNAE